VTEPSPPSLPATPGPPAAMPGPEPTEAQAVSLWVCTAPLDGVPDGYLEGAPEVLSWLFVDFGVAIDHAFATNYTEDRKARPLRGLLEPLVGSEGFVDAAVSVAEGAQLGQASFVLAVYDLSYDPAAFDLPEHAGSDHLRFLGVFERA
jgi:hypothetical protein